MRLLTLCLLVIASPSFAVECLDNEGRSVSWYFTYKFPGGYENAYHDSTTKSSSKLLKQFDRSLDDPSTPVALIRTLQQLSSRDDDDAVLPLNSSLTSSDIQYLLYNDQPPGGATVGATYGHTKGVLAASGSKAIWIIHSTPHFPSASGSKQFYFPDSEIKYGQTFLCVSMPSSEVDKVAGQLLYNRPYIYKSTFSTSAKDYPNLDKVLNKQWVTDAGSNMVSIGRFKSFAKNSAWDDDLYETLIANYYKSDLYVETWLRGSKEGSYCRPKYKYEVTDVSSVVVEAVDGSNVTWTEGSDHAKWAVMLDSSGELCVGDINRMTTQRKRGGGAVCFSNVQLNNKLYNSIDTAFNCKK